MPSHPSGRWSVVAVGAIASALRVGRHRRVLCYRLRIVWRQVDGEMVQRSFRGIDLRLGRVGGETLAAGVPRARRLGVATDMGRPMYEKMGYGVTNQITSLRVADASKLKGTMSADVEVDGCCASADAIAAIDQAATGLDRKRALQTLLAKPGALSALARDKASGDVVGAAISIVGRDGGRVIGPLLGSHEAASPLVRAVAPDGAATAKAIGAPDDILVERSHAGRLRSRGGARPPCPSAAARCPENAALTGAHAPDARLGA